MQGPETVAYMDASKCREMFVRWHRENPDPKTELNYGNPFQLLIAVILSAQSTDKAVNKATAALFRLVHRPDDLLRLGEDALKEHIKTIGLYNSKARHIMQTCAVLRDAFQGNVPEDRMALESLPGVGRKTANVVLNTAFGHPLIAVDTHIFRVANRTGIARGKDVLAVEMGLMKVVPEVFLKGAHHWLILHGRYTCVARRPRCQECLIRDLCEFPDKSTDVGKTA